MSTSLPKLVLLPGMDGAGDLFKGFVEVLSGTSFEIQTIQFPRNKVLSHTELVRIVKSAAPASEPFVLIAESFSTPLAIEYAASNPPNLKALVLCAGFATSPIRGWRRTIGSLFAVLFYLPLPRFASRFFLIGQDAPESLLSAVRTAVASVNPKVLTARLRSVLACDARAHLALVTIPILYLQAGQDRLVPPPCLKEIQRIKPKTAAATIAGPHLLLQREPQRSADVINKFIKRLG